MDLIGVVDTMFARVDMGGFACEALRGCNGHGERFDIVRRTVPGFKDLAVAAKRLIQVDGCAIVIALGMPGGAELDRLCAHEASLGIMQAQLMTNTHILEVFVHESEAPDDPQRLYDICEDRSTKHAVNAYWLLYEPEQLVARAGHGVRQGSADVGAIAR